MSKQKERPPVTQDEETIKTINEYITRYFGGEENVPITCSLQEAAAITGISYENLNALSRTNSPTKRVPGFRLRKSKYAVLVNELPAWLVRMARSCN